MSAERDREIHCRSPADNNGGFQRPHSLISCPCYQRFYPPERGRSTGPVPRPSSQRPGLWGLREVAEVGCDCALRWQTEGRWGSSEPSQTKTLYRAAPRVAFIRASLMVMIWSVQHHFQLKLAGGMWQPPVLISLWDLESAMNVDYCLRRSFHSRSKFHCDRHKGMWSLASLLDL